MCSCEKHWNPDATCTCDCTHSWSAVTEDSIIGKHIYSGKLDITAEGVEIMDEENSTRLVRYVYVHNHKCSLQGEEFVYNPPTVGGVMLISQPTCVEHGSALVLVRSESV